MEAVTQDKEVIRRDQARAAPRRYYHAHKNSFICQYCQKTLSSAYSLRSHLRTQHGHVDADPATNVSQGQPRCDSALVGVRWLGLVALLVAFGLGLMADASENDQTRHREPSPDVVAFPQ